VAMNAAWVYPAKPFLHGGLFRNSICLAAILVTFTLVGRLTLDHMRQMAIEDAYVASSAGDNESALRGYSHAIAVAPRDFAGYLRRAIVLTKLKRFDAALTDLDEAVRLSPSPPTVEALGSHAWDMAAPDTHALALVVEIRELRANLLVRFNRPEDAESDLSAAIALDSRKSELIWRRAMVRADLGRYDAAIADFDMILARRPDWRWFYGRGVAELLSDKPQPAATDFARAAELNPSNALVERWLARARQELAQST
jgi:tetratricopeptide (TPR) repeat protein